MKHLKNLILIDKFYKIIKKKNPLFFYHFNNINHHEWQKLKKQLHQIGVFDQLVIKNRMIVPAFKEIIYDKQKNRNNTFCRLKGSQTHINQMEEEDSYFYDISFLLSNIKQPKTFFSGPTLLIGCPSVKHITAINKVMEKKTKFLFLAAFIDGVAYNHLDIAKWGQLDESVYVDLIFCLKRALLFHAGIGNIYPRICSPFLNIIHPRPAIQLITCLTKNEW